MKYWWKRRGKSICIDALPTPLGFGSSVRRFKAVGAHPKFVTAGSLGKNTKVGPGTYSPENCGQKHVPCIDWRNADRVNVFSKTLGGKVPHVLAERKLRSSTLGPASHDVQEVPAMKSGSVLQNAGFSLTRRFPPDRSSVTPGPGSYGKNHVPDTLREERSQVRHTWTHVPPFEWDGFKKRRIYPDRSFSLPPNRYCPRDPQSISERVLTQVSKRGPYDLFTGPRDESTLRGYLAPPKFKGPLTYFHTLPNEMDKLKAKPIGKWMPGSRFATVPTSRNMVTCITLCRRDPDSPSPATYSPELPSTLKSQATFLYPFDSSIAEVRPEAGFKIRPGPGRYNVAYDDYVNGHTNLFRSKITDRCKWMYPEQMNAF